MSPARSFQAATLHTYKNIEMFVCGIIIIILLEDILYLPYLLNTLSTLKQSLLALTQLILIANSSIFTVVFNLCICHL